MLFRVLRQSLSLCVILLLCPKQYIHFCDAFNLTIVHNNDFHTHFAPVNINSSQCKIGEEECFGGVARTFRWSAVLFLNADDHYQGTVWYTFLKWEGVAKFVKLMKHDVMALGNHEFDDGVEGLAPFLRNVNINNPNDREIASKIPDLNVVVGGHSHSFLYTGIPPSNNWPVDTYPVVFDHTDAYS